MLSNQVQGLLLHYPEGGLKVEVSQGNQSEMFPLFWWVINPFSLSAHLCSGDFLNAGWYFCLRRIGFASKLTKQELLLWSKADVSGLRQEEERKGKKQQNWFERRFSIIDNPAVMGGVRLSPAASLKNKKKKNRKWSSTKAWLLPEKDQNTSSDYEFIWIY